MRLSLCSKPKSDLRFVAHAVRGNFLQQMFLTNYLASTLTAIPLFLCYLPLGPWSSPFHILVSVLPNLGALLSICEGTFRAHQQNTEVNTHI